MTTSWSLSGYKQIGGDFSSTFKGEDEAVISRILSQAEKHDVIALQMQPQNNARNK
jgi:hypothetical protein